MWTIYVLFIQCISKLHTGSDNFIRPSMGAWISYGLGSENENLPSFVTICPTLAHGGSQNWGSAFLPNRHQGCSVGNASVEPLEAKVGHIANLRDSFVQQRNQLQMLRTLNQSPSFHGMQEGFWKQKSKILKWPFGCNHQFQRFRIYHLSRNLSGNYTEWTKKSLKISGLNV